MSEFILDTSGHVGGQRREATDKSWFIEPFNMRFRDLTGVQQGYIQALFFTENELGTTAEDHDPETQSALPGDAGFDDLAPEFLTEIRADCDRFEETPAYKAFAAWRDDDDSSDTNPATDEQIGHDLWLTRNGHGAGFWDRPEHYYGPHQDALDAAAKAFGSVDVYVGDDGRVHS
jgi:hypothetical protein